MIRTREEKLRAAEARVVEDAVRWYKARQVWLEEERVTSPVAYGKYQDSIPVLTRAVDRLLKLEGRFKGGAT